MGKIEEKMQAEFIRWVQNEHPLYRTNVFAVDNNSQSKIRGGLSKAIGVKRGVSDLIFIAMDRVIFVELKTEYGTQKIDQKRFEKCVIKNRHEYIICRSIEELKKLFIETYY